MKNQSTIKAGAETQQKITHCPECNITLQVKEGCSSCPECGWGICS